MVPSLLALHAVCGGIALAAGTAAALTKKGSRAHVLAGRTFGVLMVGTALSAGVLSVVRPSPLLFGVGAFTLYLVVSGWLWIRPASPSTRLRRARWVGGLGLLVSLLLVYGAVVTPGFRAVLAVFAGILLALCTGDLFRSPQADQAPRLHAARMGGAFIAATTAFAVVNIDFLPGPVVWLTPSAVGALAIARATSRFYQKDS